jgi:hypothetical protein
MFEPRPLACVSTQESESIALQSTVTPHGSVPARDLSWVAMKYLKNLMVAAALTACLAAIGCDRTISKSQTSTTTSNGAVKSKETTVVQKPDGSIEKTETTQKTSPTKP